MSQTLPTDPAELRKLLDEILEAEAKATPGPWSVDNYVVNEGDSPGQWHVYESGEDDPPLLSTGLGTENDVRFIAAARNLFRPLVERLLAVDKAASAWEKLHAAACQENEQLKSRLLAVERERDKLRSLLSAVCGHFPQRNQMERHVRAAKNFLSTECQNCGTIGAPWEGHAPCNPVLPELQSQLIAAQARIKELESQVAKEPSDA